MPGKWEIINGVKYPIYDTYEEEEEVFIAPPSRQTNPELAMADLMTPEQIKLRKDLIEAQQELQELREKKKEEEEKEAARVADEKETLEYLIYTAQTLKEDARSQCLSKGLMDDTLPAGINLLQNEEGETNNLWRKDFVKNPAEEFWGTLPVTGPKKPNTKGKNISFSEKGKYNISSTTYYDKSEGCYVHEDETPFLANEPIPFVLELRDGQVVRKTLNDFASLIVYFFEGYQGFNGLTKEEWQDFGFWKSDKWTETMNSPNFQEYEALFKKIESEIGEKGKSSIIEKGKPITLGSSHWPTIEKLYKGADFVPKKGFQLNPRATEWNPSSYNQVIHAYAVE
jgi:hypothetical protein